MKDFAVYTGLRLGLFLLTWAAVTGAWLLVTDDAALGLTQPQLVSVAMILAGGAWLVFRRSAVAAPVTRAA